MRNLFICALVLISCGVQNRNYDNPNDTESSSAGKASGAGPGSPSNGGNSGTGSGANNAPTGTAFNFANSFNVTPTGCSDVKMVRMFENSGELMVFVQAKCSNKNNIYSYRAGYDGTASSVPTSVTSNCGGTTGISYGIAEKGASGYLVVYRCYNDNKIYTVTLDSNAVAGTPIYYGNTFSGPYELIWNSAASAYGLKGSSFFQRFNASGTAVGGETSSLGSLSLAGDTWMITRNNGTYQAIGPNGTSTCTSIKALSGLSVSRGIFVTAGYFIGNSSATLYGGSVDIATCGTGSASAVYNHSVNYFYGGFALNQSYGVTLYTGSSNLQVTSFPVTGDFSVLADSVVTNESSKVSDAFMKVINGKIYVGYAKDGTGTIVYSNENAAN